MENWWTFWNLNITKLLNTKGSENNRISISMEGSDLGDFCLSFKNWKNKRWCWNERSCDIVVMMFRIEMDIDFRVLHTVETRHFLGKARCCLRGSLSRAKRNRSSAVAVKALKATGWSPPMFVVLVKFCRVLRNSVKEIFRSQFKRSDELLFLLTEKVAWKFICLFVVSVALVYREFMFFAPFKTCRNM